MKNLSNHRLTVGHVLVKVLGMVALINAGIIVTPVAAVDHATKEFVSPAQPLADSLIALSQHYDTIIVAPQNLLDGLQAPEVNGQLNKIDALQRLLLGTGLAFEQADDGAIMIKYPARAGAQPPTRSHFQFAEDGDSRLVQQTESLEDIVTTAERKTDESVSMRQDNEIDEILVTGSRIRRSNATAAIPVQILSQDDINEVGSADIGEILREIPGVDASLSPENSSTIFQNSGLSTVNLRRLGGNRTLTLIDGRRAVSNSGNGERVSLNTIPAGFVQSIEVTTGGASAVYGSDAIAGVANVILKDNFDGMEFAIRGSGADRSGEREKTVDLTVGQSFASDRGYLLFGLSYDDESAIYADATRPASIANLEFNSPNRSRLPGEADNPNAFGSEINFGNCDGSGRFCINPSGSSFLPGGLFEGDDAWNIDGIWFNDRSLLPNDGRLGAFAFEPDSDGYNFRPGRTLSTPIEVMATALKFDFALTPQTNLFLDMNYAEIDTMARNAPLNASNGTDIGIDNALGDIGDIAADHPFIPAAVEETRTGTVSWRRRFVEIGFNDWVNERKTLRSAVGFEGNILSDWQWTLHGTYGRFEQDQQFRNQLHYLNIRNALTIESDGTGGFQCTDPEARANGCVPLNLFGEGSIDDRAARYIRYTGQLDQVREQTTLAGSMDGEAWQLSAGPIKAAFGFEYRKEEQQTIGDPDNQFGLTSVPFIPDITADFDVTELFAEFDVPIVRDRLSLQLAARGADYSTVGRVFSYNIGGSWQPILDARFRAQYSRSQRAPTLTEFFSPPRGDFDGLLDPCNGLNADGSGITPAAGSNADPAVIAANCLSELGIQAFFANPDNAGEAFLYNASVFGPNAGNSELQEETADTFTAGVIFQPRYIADLTVIVDYYEITVEDAIGSVSTQTTADLCYGDANFPNNRFCGVITRDASTGFVTEVINRQENLNELQVAGIDTTIDYRWKIPAVAGTFDLNLRYAHYLKENFTFLSVGGPQKEDFLGGIGEPEDEYRARLAWDYQGLRVAWTARYRAGGIDDLDLTPEDNAFFRTGGQTYHNLNVRYLLGSDPRIRIFAGINNVANELGPLLPTGLDNGSTRNIISSLTDLEGREFYAGVNVRW